MARGQLWWALAVAFGGASLAFAQGDGYEIPGVSRTPAKPKVVYDPRPTSPYDLKADAGPWLVVVKSFKGEREEYDEQTNRLIPDRRVKDLAEQFAAFIRKEYRIPAYVYPMGWEQRERQDKEAQEYRKACRKYYWETYQTEPTKEQLKVKTISIPDEYTVFVGPARGQLKDREVAMDFANQVRKLKAPDDFNDSLLQGSDVDGSRAKGNSFNAFRACMPGMNPKAPRAAVDTQTVKAEKYLMEMNSAESYSLLHKTRKKWTLLVQTYGGGGSIMQTGATGTSGGEASNRLELAGQQAHQMAEVLRKEFRVDAYVMHTRYQSLVFVGDYEDEKDPQLVASIATYAKMQIKDKNGKVLETFMEKPKPVMIPKP